MSADGVPATGRHDLVVVDGRTFAISGEAGDMEHPTHGLVYDDVRHLSRLRMRVIGGAVELLASRAPTPLSAVVVCRLATPVEDDGHHRGHRTADALLIRRRWLRGSLVEELTLRNPLAHSITVEVELELAADFVHVFDVKAGLPSGSAGRIVVGDGPDTWIVASPHDDTDSTSVFLQPPPDEADVAAGTARWRLTVEAGGEARVVVTVQPVSAGVAADLEPTSKLTGTLAIRELDGWRSTVPRAVSLDSRIPPALDQAVADLAALRIVDQAHPERAVVAAGAPWFMTLFGRDSLLTSWMTLPFDAVAGGRRAGQPCRSSRHA